MKSEAGDIEARFGDLNVYVAADYSQMEMRVLAELSNCKGLIAAMKRGTDIHAAVGHDMTGLPEERFKEGRQRVFMKSLHFSIVFGKDDEGLYESLVTSGIETTQEEVTKFYNDYFERYPEVRAYMDSQQAFADKYGYVKTLFGFEREISKYDESRGSYWVNQSLNSSVQGTAHQVLLVALAERKRLPKTFWALKDMRMEVHDAFYWIIALRHLRQAHKQAKYLLEIHVKEAVKRRFGIEIRVPFVAEIKAGFRLGVMVEYGGESLDRFLRSWLIKNHKVEAEVQGFLTALKS